MFILEHKCTNNSLETSTHLKPQTPNLLSATKYRRYTGFFRHKNASYKTHTPLQASLGCPEGTAVDVCDIVVWLGANLFFLLNTCKLLAL